MSEAFDLTTYYAKRIIGDTAASSESSALLQTGSGVTGDTWILHRDNRTSKLYGIKYAYDSSGNDKIEYYGKNANDNATAWIQLNTGDASFNSILGKVEVTNTAIPGTGTAYYFPYITGNTTSTYGLLSSNRLYLYEASNTTYFCIGATDRTGGLTIRNANGKYADIVTSAFSANRTLTIPDQTGTIALLTKTDINALINLLDTGSSVLTAEDYIITQYVGGGTTTTTYHRRAAKNVRVGGLTTARNINGTAFDGTANITTANWGTTRSLTIGNKAQDVNGSAAVTWSLNDILYNATQIGTATSWDQIGPSVYYVASSSAFTGTNHPGNNSEQMPYTYGQLIVSRAGSGGILQVYASHHASNSGAINEGLRYRTGWNSGGWQAWSTLLDDRLWRKYIFANKNIGRTTLTVTDSTWAVTSGTDVFGLSFKDTGLTYTPSGGSATASSDTGDWRAWLTCDAAANNVKLNMRIDGSFQSDVLYTSYIDAYGAAQPTAGKLAGLTGAHSRLYGNALYITNPTTTNDQGWIRVLGTGETDTVLEIATGDDGGVGEQIVCRQYNTSNAVARELKLLDTNGNSTFPGDITIAHAIGDTALTASSKNPRIIFSENGSQPVHIAYTDWDSYRAPAGLKVVGGASATPAWFEIEGNVYFGGDGIYHVGTAATQRIIRIIDSGDQYGTGVSIGAGGLALFGGGESANTLISSLSLTAGGTETTYISADNSIEFYPNQNSYDASSHITMTNGSIWAGIAGNTTRENQVGVRSGAGAIYMYAQAATGGSRGIYLLAHGTGSAKGIVTVDTNNNATFTGTFSGNCTGNSNTANYQNCVATNEIRYNRNGNMASANDLWQGWAFAEGKVAVINGWRFGNGNGALAPIYGSKIYNAIWNDFAEYRESDVFEGGRVLVSDGHGKLVLATERLQPAARVISDTFGCSVGQSDKAKTPIGVAGRVLVYPYQDRNNYKVGDCLCAAPNGTADIMTREEIINYPDRIIGIVDEIPIYEVWQQSLTNYKKKDNGEIDEIGEKNTTDTKVNGRIWIYVR